MPVNAVFAPPTPVNEPVKSYAPGSPERASLKRELQAMEGVQASLPNVIAGERIETGNTRAVTMPCDHGHVLGHLHYPTAEQVTGAIQAAKHAARDWANAPWQDRAAVFLKAAELAAGPWRDKLNAATMLGQSKTCHQAEIDAACELIDFLRFNVTYARDLMAQQPSSGDGVWNYVDHRPLEGFVFAITPFNFTAIACNLPTAPALMGNTVVWKPSPTAALSNQVVMDLLMAAGLPAGVINLVHGEGADVGDIALADRDLAGVHFTGSTAVFRHILSTVGGNIASYRSYPRVVGETGGKDFVVAHPSADAKALTVALARGAFEFQGQKCSAASRAYVPASLWPEVSEGLVAAVEAMKQGDVRDFSNFLGAVIDQRSFDKISGYLGAAHDSAKVLVGGQADASTGWFVQPTVVRVPEPGHRLMREEIFGPVLSLYVYDDDRFAETLQTVDATSPYALTGSIFAQDRVAVRQAATALRHAAGNFYINDKPTGAVVGQQPFGGGRASGTNDKAGAPWNLQRWTSPRTIKETLCPPQDWRYPFLG